MAEHDPMTFATSLGAKLASRSRHVCFFLGAGVGKACGLPDIAELQERLLRDLDERNATAFKRQLSGRNLEEALSRLRRIAALVSGDDTVDDLTTQMATELDRIVCRAIVNALTPSDVNLTAAGHLAAWVARANYHRPIELFTVNYDLLLETALETMRAPYFDGFVGTLKARFHTELVEELPGPAETEAIPVSFVRLWKLHGSVNWASGDGRQIVRLGHPVPDGRPAAIYPSDAKYDESRRLPFIVLQDRLRRALHQPETMLLITGYSFGDDHLNEHIFDAASRRARSEFVAFCYGSIPDVLAERAAITPNFQVVSDNDAILGGTRACWKEPKDAPPDIWEDGYFGMGDFQKLAKFLARSADPDAQT